MNQRQTTGERLAALILIFLVATVVATPVAAQQPPLEGLNEYIEEGMDAWKVPGLALSIVHNDSVVFARGYGVRELGEPERVDARTIFAIGSSSKAFTATSVGMLVDEGEVKWDDHATKHLPRFQLYDPYVTRELTVRDMLTHRSGLSRGDLLWIAGEYTRDEVLHRVRFLEPTWSFRAHFGYQNIMYLAAGQVVENVTGKTWDEFVDERIFTPLGMAVSNTSTRDLAGLDDVATPHAEIDGEVRAIAWRSIDNIAPAGSINSNVLEMAQWVRLHLGEGTYEGQELVSPEVIAEMQLPQTIVRLEGGWELMAPASHLMAYGFGWFLNDYRGRKVVQHGGNIDGMSAMVAMIPEEELGLVILTNLNGTSLRDALMYRVFDYYLDGPDTDWSARLLAVVDSMEAEAEARQMKVREARVEGTTPSLPLEDYVGSYTDEMYGEATVALENERLMVHYGKAFSGPLEHWHYDTFRADWHDAVLGESFITFTLDAMGEVAAVEVENMAEFQRVPEPAAETEVTAGSR